MAGKTFTTTISINGEVDASVQKAFAGMSERLSAVQRAAVQAAGVTDRLTAAIDRQTDELESAKKAYTDYILSGEKSKKKAKELASNIQKLAGELNDNERKLLDAQGAAEKLAGGLDDAGDAAHNTKGGFSVMKGAIAGVIANGVTALISKCAEAAKAIYGLAESTREYREDMNKLDTAFAAANHSAASAEATYKTLYGVIGETDQAVEAAQQIALLADTEQDAAKWADLAAGVVGRFGDALQPETFFESANETLKLGEATGAFTQMLEGAGYSVEDFNTYLAKCTTEAEKQAYMLAFTEKILGEASDTYREANASIIEARDAQAEYTDITAEMGKAIEPVTSAVQRGLNKLLKKALELINKVDLAGFADGITMAFERLAPILDVVIDEGMEIGGQLIGAIMPILPPLLSLIGQLGGFLGDIIPVLVQIVAAIMPVVAQLVTGLTPAVMTVLNALTPVISLIGNLVQLLLPPLSSLISSIIPIIQFLAQVLSENLGFAISNLTPFLTGLATHIGNIITILSSVIDFIVNVFTGNWKGAWTSAVNIFKGIFNAIPNYVETVINGAIAVVNNMLSGINKLGDYVGFKIELIPTVDIPGFYSGGFTNGLSIAGEDPNYPTEAVISFNPAYRSQNISYWARAGQMLGVDYPLGSVGGSNIDFGGVTFAPNITVSGNANKESIMEAIEAEYPEFLDMLEEYFMQRSVTVYA